jgi:hypothetical protein
MEPTNGDEPLTEDSPLHEHPVVRGGTNIVHYQRRAGQSLHMEGTQQSGEVLFIDESTPTPTLPSRQSHIPFHLRSSGDEDVLYIGPE